MEIDTPDLRAFCREWRAELSLDEEGSPTTASTSSSYEITRYSSPASSIEDINTHRPTNPSVCIDIINEIDPQLLSHPIVPYIRDESLCSSTDSATFTSPRRPVTSVHSTIEHCMSLDKEGAHPLKHGSSVEDIDPDQRATTLAIDAKNAEALSTIGDTLSAMKLVKDLPLVMNSAGTTSKQRDPNCPDGDSVSASGSCIDARSRDVPIILDYNESNEPEFSGDRGDRYTEHSRGISASSLQIISLSLLRAEATEGDYLPASVQTTQQLEPQAVVPEDDQYIVERLL